MYDVIFTLYDMIHMALMLAACYACYRAGKNKGIDDTLLYFEKEGIIEIEE